MTTTFGRIPTARPGAQRAKLTAAAALVLALACGCAACRRSPAAPDQTLLDIGRWSGDGACLSVTDAGCDLIVGCGHGRFPRPIIRTDGTFDVDGTYRIEAGPVSIEPAPPAHFAGSVSGMGLVLTVVPVSLPKASYGFVQSDSGRCSILCLSVGNTYVFRTKVFRNGTLFRPSLFNFPQKIQ